jgi:hypothetical protein
MHASQARTPSEPIVVSISASSMESTRHPSAKLALISSYATRRGAESPGCSSLKQSMK